MNDVSMMTSLPTIPDYVLVEELGRGGMGRIFKARQLSLPRLVAIKMMLSAADADTQEYARFRKEAEAMALLRHPHILTIYQVGEVNGCPYIVMELVEGGNLAQRLAGKPRFDYPAVALLLEQVARAVHYAHQQGVLHRDLKPSNILLTGRSGPSASRDTNQARPTTTEDAAAPVAALVDSAPVTQPIDDQPKISDFGLARQLHHGPGMTQSGAVVGTPNYMPPEQARGLTKELGPTADVYSLGAILYEMLTGRPPFQASTSWEVIMQVLSEEPAAPRRLQPQVPADLNTICLKCLEKNAAKRYDSAEVLADDLRRYLEGRPLVARPVGVVGQTWRWCRRRPALASLIAVSVLAVVALVAGSLYAAWTISAALTQEKQARDLAENRLGVAVNAIDTMLSRLAGIDLVELPHFDPARKEMLQQARRLYQQLLEDDRQEPRVRRRLAVAHVSLGQVHSLLGEYAEAETMFSEAIHRLTALSDTSPHELADAWGALGLNHIRRGRYSEANQTFDKAFELMGPVSALTAEERQSLLTLSANQTLLLEHLGTRADAEVIYLRVVKHLNDLKDDSGDHPELRRLTAQAWANLGAYLSLRGRYLEARDNFQRSQNMLDSLSPAYLRQRTCRVNQASNTRNLSQILLELGEIDEADRLARLSLQEWEQLGSNYPDDFSCQRWLAGACYVQGRVLVARLRISEARDCFAESLRRFEDIKKRFPGVSVPLPEIAQAWNARGDTELILEQGPAARRSYEQAVGILEQLVKEPDASVALQRLLLTGLVGWGSALGTTGQLPEGEKKYRRALDMAEQLPSAVIDDPNCQAKIALAHYGMGLMKQLRNNLAEAGQSYAVAVQRLQPLVTRQPANLEFRRYLGQALSNHGRILFLQGKATEAEPVLRQACEQFRATATTLRGAADAAKGCSLYGYVWAARKDFTSAQKMFREGITHLKMVMKQSPATQAQRVELAELLKLLALAHLQAADHVGLASVSDEMTQTFPEDGSSFGNRACLLSLCMGLAGRDAMLNAEQKRKLIRSYGDRAMAALKQAKQKGMPNFVRFVTSEVDLTPLRDHAELGPEVKKLIAESGNP